MSASACEERGADLFLVARGEAPSPDLDSHLAGCGGCRADLERLRGLARDLREADRGLAPRPATRAAVLRETAAPGPAAFPPTPPALPPGLPRRGRLLRLVLPAAAAVAGIAATVFVIARGDRAPQVDAAGGSIAVTPLWNGAELEGLLPGGLRAGSEIVARRVASVRLGEPIGAEVVLAEGTRLRLPAEGAGRTVEILAGLAWFDPAPAGPVPAGAEPRPSLRVRAEGLEVEERGAHFTVERRKSGASSVYLETGGVAVVRSGGSAITASGPCRIDVAPGAAPGDPVPVETGDATGWFACPDLSLEERAGPGPGGRELVVVLRPAVPVRIRIAAWNRFDPLFSFRAAVPGNPPVSIPLGPGMFRVPPPPGDGEGAFLLSTEKPYKIVVESGSLGLAPGKYRLTAVYSSNRPGGLWKGTRASNEVDFEVAGSGGK